jgi:hypothetical protein
MELKQIDAWFFSTTILRYTYEHYLRLSADPAVGGLSEFPDEVRMAYTLCGGTENLSPANVSRWARSFFSGWYLRIEDYAQESHLQNDDIFLLEQFVREGSAVGTFEELDEVFIDTFGDYRGFARLLIGLARTQDTVAKGLHEPRLYDQLHLIFKVREDTAYYLSWTIFGNLGDPPYLFG